MVNLFHVVLLPLCAVICAATVPTEGDSTLAALRALVSERAPLVSFRGEYTLEQRDGAGKVGFLQRHSCRFQGEDSYLRIENLQGGSPLTLTFACVNRLYAIREESPCAISADLDIGFSEIPWGAYLSPKELLGDLHGRWLSQLLAEGESRLFTHEGHSVLSHRREAGAGSCVDIHFSSDSSIIEIDQCLRPPFNDEEVRRWWSGDLFEVRRLITTLELNTPVEIDGIIFPAAATKTWWSYEKARYTDYYSMATAGVISSVEAYVKDCTMNVQVPSAIQDLRLDPGTVEINRNLSDQELSLELPAGTLVQDNKSGTQYLVATQSPGWRGKITRFIAARKDAKMLNVAFGIHLAENTVLLAAEPLPRWLKPALIAGFAGCLVSFSVFDSLKRRKRKRLGL